MESSNWTYAQRLRNLKAAKDWGMTPGKFDNTNMEDKLDIIAIYEINWRMNAINSHEIQRKMKVKPKKRK